MTGVIFWSGTGNTETMAEAIKANLEAAGQEVEMSRVEEANVDTVASYDKIAFGCPAMGDEVLEEMDFDPFFSALEGKLSGKKIALFGSYGWGTGDWMTSWVARVEAAGATVVGSVIANYAPDDEAKAGLEELAKKLANA